MTGSEGVRRGMYYLLPLDSPRPRVHEGFDLGSNAVSASSV